MHSQNCASVAEEVMPGESQASCMMHSDCPRLRYASISRDQATDLMSEQAASQHVLLLLVTSVSDIQQVRSPAFRCPVDMSWGASAAMHQG